MTGLQWQYQNLQWAREQQREAERENIILKKHLFKTYTAYDDCTASIQNNIEFPFVLIFLGAIASQDFGYESQRDSDHKVIVGC